MTVYTSDEEIFAQFVVTLKNSSSEKIKELFEHVFRQQGGHPDTEFDECGFEGRIDDGEYREALMSEYELRFGRMPQSC